MSLESILATAARREILPLELSSRDIRDSIAADIRRRSLFVARGTNLQWLTRLAKVLDAYLAGTMNDADARLSLLEEGLRLGYTPEGGFPDADPGAVPPAEAGTIQDILSPGRLQMILDTQAQLMFGAGQKAAGETPGQAYDYPAWELLRVSPRETPRGFRRIEAGLIPVPSEAWPSRFIKAGGSVRGERLIALKGSRIWQDLGSSEIFDDALDTDHPPFAFNSGMGWSPVDRATCISLGLIASDWKPEGFRAWRLNEDAKVGAKRIPKDLIKAAITELDAELVGSTLRIREARDAARRAYLS